MSEISAQGKIIADRLRTLGLTRYRLAKITGIDESNLIRVYSGHRTLATAETIGPVAEALQMENADPLYLAAGKVPPDVIDTLLRHPDLITAVRRIAAKMDTLQEDDD